MNWPTGASPIEASFFSFLYLFRELACFKKGLEEGLLIDELNAFDRGLNKLTIYLSVAGRLPAWGIRFVNPSVSLFLENLNKTVNT